MEELQSPFQGLEVFACLCSLALGAILAAHLAAGTFHPLDMDLNGDVCVGLALHLEHVLLVVEGQDARDIFVNDLDGGYNDVPKSTLATCAGVHSRFKKLAVELLLVFAAVIVHNLHLERLLRFVSGEAKAALNGCEVFTRRGGAIFCPVGNTARKVEHAAAGNHDFHMSAILHTGYRHHREAEDTAVFLRLCALLILGNWHDLVRWHAVACWHNLLALRLGVLPPSVGGNASGLAALDLHDLRHLFSCDCRTMPVPDVLLKVLELLGRHVGGDDCPPAL
mmetsp:Transcript_72468/g.169758  ORF Transcript_72468/g.169758 Transcript_72468/m.169758 type:complete len:280 (+) Transcript_72468:1130-1969(+)